MIRLEETLHLLTDHNVEFVIVGGVAITWHGSAYITYDLDVCYSRSSENLKRVVSALRDHSPRLRDFPEGLPFIWDEATLQHGMNFTLKTDLGEIDLLGEVTGLGDYNTVNSEAVVIPIFGLACKVLSIPALIKAKRAAGRPKDLLVIPELEALLEISNSGGSDDLERSGGSDAH